MHRASVRSLQENQSLSWNARGGSVCYLHHHGVARRLERLGVHEVAAQADILEHRNEDCLQRAVVRHA